jgi:hypothetical protein
VIVRIVLWRLDETSRSFEDIRERLEELEPLAPPSALLVNEATERLGALLVTEDDELVPGQLDELRALIGRDPDLYEEFDAL